MAKIKLEIVTVERLVLSEDVDFVSAPGVDGVLGILPRHAPLVTALTFGELRYKKDGTESHFAIGGGFMEVRPDKVTVLADTAEQADEIDESRAAMIEQSLRRAELRLRVAKRRRTDRRPMEGGEN